MKNLNEVRETVTFYGTEKADAVDLITMVVGRSLAPSTHERFAKMTLNEVSNLTMDELMTYEGIGKVAAGRITASIGLGKALRSDRFAQKDSIVSSTSAKRTFEYMRNLEQEHVDVAYLDTKSNIISLRNIFKGSLNASVAHPREIFKDAVKLSAAKIMVAHNHPSGDPDPSPADITFTRRLMEAGDLMGIEVVDHIIVGEDILSLREEGFMN